jgi:hypothetical protein
MGIFMQKMREICKPQMDPMTFLTALSTTVHTLHGELIKAEDVEAKTAKILIGNSKRFIRARSRTPEIRPACRDSATTSPDSKKPRTGSTDTGRGKQVNGPRTPSPLRPIRERLGPALDDSRQRTPWTKRNQKKMQTRRN